MDGPTFRNAAELLNRTHMTGDLPHFRHHLGGKVAQLTAATRLEL